MVGKTDKRPAGFHLPSGSRIIPQPLPEPMVFRDIEPRLAVHLVGFLSQKLGSELRILSATGEVIEVRRFEPVVSIPGAVGGLRGPTEMMGHSGT
jgi:hypothetical protein